MLAQLARRKIHYAGIGKRWRSFTLSSSADPLRVTCYRCRKCLNKAKLNAD